MPDSGIGARELEINQKNGTIKKFTVPLNLDFIKFYFLLNYLVVN